MNKPKLTALHQPISYGGTAILAALALMLPTLMLPKTASAQDISLNDAMTAYCQNQGITPQACQCWFSKIAAAEAFSDFTAQDIQDLAPHYQEELVACKAES